jgi:ribonuclease HII
VKDSKAYTSHATRKQVALRLEQHAARVDHQYAQIEATAINVHGMAWALRTAFERAVNALSPAPDLVLVDGNAGIPGWSGPQQHRPKADVLWWPVSAASVLAKVYRDDLMDLLDQEFPVYGWKTSKGYGTAAHIAALQQHGATVLHRTQFVATALHTAAGKP